MLKLIKLYQQHQTKVLYILVVLLAVACIYLITRTPKTITKTEIKTVTETKVEYKDKIVYKERDEQVRRVVLKEKLNQQREVIERVTETEERISNEKLQSKEQSKTNTTRDARTSTTIMATNTQKSRYILGLSSNYSGNSIYGTVGFRLASLPVLGTISYNYKKSDNSFKNLHIGIMLEL
jgi:LAS superfamily LD-carboxypeptidase LdcB